MHSALSKRHLSPAGKSGGTPSSARAEKLRQLLDQAQHGPLLVLRLQHDIQGQMGDGMEGFLKIPDIDSAGMGPGGFSFRLVRKMKLGPVVCFSPGLYCGLN